MRKMMMVVMMILGLMIAPVSAQQKPVGLFDNSCNAPAWASFGQLAEWDDFAVAADCSRRTGRTWVLVLFFDNHKHIQSVRTRAVNAGLAPYILALTYREEPYQHYRLGLSLPPRLEDELAENPHADPVTRLNIVRDHWSEAHARIHVAWPGPLVAWITPWVNDSLAYGVDLYSPLPDGVDVLVLDPYATDGMPFSAWPEVVIQYAVQTTTLPIALVPQWFTQPGTSISQPRDFVGDYLRWLRHPRVVALWGFTWASRPGIIGLKDLPALKASVESALRNR